MCFVVPVAGERTTVTLDSAVRLRTGDELRMGPMEVVVTSVYFPPGSAGAASSPMAHVRTAGSVSAVHVIPSSRMSPSHSTTGGTDSPPFTHSQPFVPSSYLS